MATTFLEKSVIEQIDAGCLHFHHDPNSDCFAIIALAHPERGPAIGGCRCLPYPDTASAIQDALRLAEAMAKKAHHAKLPYSGGKAVLLRPQHINDRRTYFQSFARFVHSLNGQYITTVDSGTNPADMAIVARHTPYVITSNTAEPTAYYTALGVVQGMKAALMHRFGTSSLDGRHIAIQGVGKVGYQLVKLLSQQHARISVADTSADHLAKLSPFNVTIVPTKDILSLPCDILSPCALGGVIHQQNIPQLHCAIIAGAANNLLQQEDDRQHLQAKGILYAPDVIINAGGLIHCAASYRQTSLTQLTSQIDAIYQRTLASFS